MKLIRTSAVNCMLDSNVRLPQCLLWTRRKFLLCYFHVMDQHKTTTVEDTCDTSQVMFTTAAPCFCANTNTRTHTQLTPTHLPSFSVLPHQNLAGLMHTALNAYRTHLFHAHRPTHLTMTEAQWTSSCLNSCFPRHGPGWPV